MNKRDRKNVYKAYNKIACWFSENRDTGLMEKNYLDGLIAHLPVNATVLDLGCGTGNPILKYLLSNNLNVTGVDGSHEMVKIAKESFPQATLVLQDMRVLNLDHKFDAIIAWHSLFHLPAADQPAMFKVFKEHMNDEGILLFTSGTEHGETWTTNGGEELFMASLDAQEYERLLIEHNFKVLKYKANDAYCGNANIWMAQYRPPVNNHL